ncbi:hypothetical protein ACFVMC_24875 [Nocardia sp. NPDC127579]|uniref:hypothetical protein n=1 Tax=Nocardia sp. NPDC127579 TaxID=3345402 RepID=UPI00362C834C
MSTFLTFLTVFAFSYAVYHFAPARRKELFRLERFVGPGPLFESTATTDYEAQRQYSDLAALHSRHQDDTAAAAEPHRARPLRTINPSCGTVQASFS